jgi:hypothetical protein
MTTNKFCKCKRIVHHHPQLNGNENLLLKTQVNPHQVTKSSTYFGRE